MAGYKINIHKLVAFLYANNKVAEREIKKKTLFTTASRRIKYLGINPTKGVKDLYSVNYKTLMKETEDDTNKWRIFHAYGLEELILLKYPYYLKQSTDSMQSLSK